MSKYQINHIKHVSNARKYEYLHKHGVAVGTGGDFRELSGKALDDYIEEQIWREAHPGQDPIQEWEDGVPTE